MTRRRPEVIETRCPDAVLASALAESLVERDEAVSERWGLAPADLVAARRRTATDSGFDALYRRALTRARLTWRTAQAQASVLANRELARRIAEDPASLSAVELVAVTRGAAAALIEASALVADDAEGADLADNNDTPPRSLALGSGS